MVKNKEEAAKIFNDIIQNDRDKKKREDLANQILGSGGRKSTGPGAAKDRRNNGPSLASRMGVTKVNSTNLRVDKHFKLTFKPSQRAASTSSARPNVSRANTDRNTDIGAALRGTPPQNQRVARVSNLSRTASDSRLNQRNRLFEGLVNNTAPQPAKEQVNIRGRQSLPANNGEFSVRGMGSGGPCTVIASNFALGTTAADIEAAVISPIGGEVMSCRLVSSNPTVIAEIVFADRKGADAVISTFNNKKADGRLLYVYLKEATVPQAPINRPPPRRLTPPPQYNNSQDEEMMDMEVDDRDNRPEPPRQDERLRRAEPSYQDGTQGFTEDLQPDESLRPQQPHPPPHVPRGPWRGGRGGRGDRGDRGDRNEYRPSYGRGEMRGDRRDDYRDDRRDDRGYDRRDRFEPSGRLYSDGMFHRGRGGHQRYRS